MAPAFVPKQEPQTGKALQHRHAADIGELGMVAAPATSAMARLVSMALIQYCPFVHQADRQPVAQHKEVGGTSPNMTSGLR
jgi:hypothetical protein